mmetsp:Transcript_972/g.1980  ORF Transcript_972/g.1980 Transcript_972/m.1980 type:complete len:477 (+) Transcript_972:39-1469(+)
MAFSPSRKRYSLEGRARSTSSTPNSTSSLLLQGKYKVSKEKVLGEGGFGKVYQGLDVLECKGVAVKVYKDAQDGSMDNFKKTVDVLLTIRRRATRSAPEGGFDSTMEFSLFEASTMSFKPSLLSEDITSLGEAFRGGAQSIIGQMDFTGCFVNILGYSRDHLGAPGLDVDSESLFIVYELGQESLQDRLMRCAMEGRSLRPSELRRLQWDLVTIVCGLHSQGFVHLDIKPPNIVRFKRENGESRWKLIDLDGAMKTGITVPLESLSVTKHYMSPELAIAYLRATQRDQSGFLESPSRARGLQLSRLMDVWSVGMCALEAIFLTPVLGPWYAEWKQQTGSDVKFMTWLADLSAEPIVSGDMQEALADIDPDMCDMLRGMLAKDVLGRYSITECLTHQWFEPIRKEILKDVQALLELPSPNSAEVQMLKEEDLPPRPVGPAPALNLKSKASASPAASERTVESQKMAKGVAARACMVM